MARSKHTVGLSSGVLKAQQAMTLVQPKQPRQGQYKPHEKRDINGVDHVEPLKAINSDKNTLNNTDVQDNEDLGSQNQPDLPIIQKTVSKRSLRLAKLKGEIGSDDKLKGEIQFDNEGNMYQRENDKEAWKPAIFHEDIRAALIARASRRGQYDHHRARGHDDLDVTSFLPSQKTWGAEREHWPEILHQIHKLPEQEQGTKASVWFYHGNIVLDPDNHPVLNYPEIPATCSSELEGWCMQAIKRANIHISIRDFRARMPHFVGRNQKPLHRVNAISMRMTRFRAEAGCQVWDLRAGSKKINDYMMSLYPAWCIENNSTKSFPGLTKTQVETMSQILKGKFPERARAKPGLQLREKKEAVMPGEDARKASHRQNQGSSIVGRKRKHSGFKEQIASRRQTYPSIETRTRTDDAVNGISGRNVLIQIPSRKRALKGVASDDEDDDSGEEELNDRTEIKRRRFGSDCSQTIHEHRELFSRSNSELSKANGSVNQRPTLSSPSSQRTVSCSPSQGSFDQGASKEDDSDADSNSDMASMSMSEGGRSTASRATHPIGFGFHKVPMETQYSSGDET